MRVPKVAEQEDPEFTSSHGHTEITTIAELLTRVEKEMAPTAAFLPGESHRQSSLGLWSMGSQSQTRLK